jgi:hypothetical protein
MKNGFRAKELQKNIKFLSRFLLDDVENNFIIMRNPLDIRSKKVYSWLIDIEQKTLKKKFLR